MTSSRRPRLASLGALLLVALFFAPPGGVGFAFGATALPHGGGRAGSSERRGPDLFQTNGTPSAPWTNVTSPNFTRVPFAVQSFAMAYDAADQYVVAYGGYSDGLGLAIDQTWTYRNTVWTNITSDPPSSPPARRGAMMAYDAADGYVILFGGGDTSGSNLYPDTWKFLHGHWTDITSAHPNASNTPSGRFYGSLAYDPARSAVILYGGYGGNVQPAALNDTWEFSNGTWTNLTSSLGPSPPALYDASMAWDGTDNELVLVGGYNASGDVQAATWALTSAGWQGVGSFHSASPPTDPGSYFAWNPNDGYDVWYGGGETWSFANGTWAQVPTGLSSTPGQRTGLAESGTYDAADGYDLLWGGASGDQDLNTTWIFDGRLHAITTVSRAALDANESMTIATVPIGGAAPYGFAYSGLPSDCAPGNVSRFACTFPTVGHYNVTINVTDSGGNYTLRPLNLTVFPTLEISGSVAPSAIDLDEAVNYTVVASGGSGNLSFTYSNLPSGCTTYNVSRLPCLPSATGASSASVAVSDTSGIVVPLYDLNLTVYPALGAGITPHYVGIDLGQSFSLAGNGSGGHGQLTPHWIGLPSNCTEGAVWNFTCQPNATGSWRVFLQVEDALPDTLEVGPTVVTVSPLPTVQLAASGLEGVAPFSVVFTETPANGTSPYSVNWSFGDGSSPVTDGMSVVSHTFAAPGNYTVQVTDRDAVGHTFAAEATVQVVAPLAVQLRAEPRGDVFDAGAPLELDTSVTGGGAPLDFAWVGLPPGCTAADVPVIRCTVSTWGSYRPTVFVTDPLGENVTASADLTVASTLTVTLTLYQGTLTCQGPYDERGGANQAGGVGPYHYNWTFGDGTTGTLIGGTIDHPYAQSGQYPVSVTVTDSAGGVANATGTAVVGPSGCPALFLGVPVTAGGWGLIIAGLAAVLVVAAVVLIRRGRTRSEAEPPAEPADEPPMYGEEARPEGSE